MGDSRGRDGQAAGLVLTAPWRPVLVPALPERDGAPLFRAAVLLVCVLLTALADAPARALLVLGALGACAAASRTARGTADRLLRLAVLEAAVAGVGVVLTGGPQSPVLPYLLAPAVCAVLVAGHRGALLASGSAAAAVLLTGVAARGADRPHLSLPDLAAATATWLLLSLAAAALVSRALLVSAPAQPGDRYAEARGLLEQLRAVSRRLPGGLDVVSVAEVLLAEAATLSGATRSAVLVQPAGGSLVPAAVRGTTRVPWRAPLSEPGPLRQAWDTGRPAVDRRRPDAGAEDGPAGRRCGSVLAVVPLLAGGVAFGLLVLESYDQAAFPEDVMAAVCERAGGSALRLETALLFEEVRSAVTVAERDRLAREIHDGVAQDLAFVGYCLDDLRHHAAKVDAGLAGRVLEVRGSLTRLISDLRLSITDLRTSVASDRGLGSALSSYVRAAGNGQRLRVHLTLAESAFRLPGEQEVLLFHVAQAIAQDARRTGATDLWVELVVDPPRAALTVQHDGPPTPGLLDPWVDQVAAAGGDLTVTARPGGGVVATLTLAGGVP